MSGILSMRAKTDGGGEIGRILVFEWGLNARCRTRWDWMGGWRVSERRRIRLTLMR